MAYMAPMAHMAHMAPMAPRLRRRQRGRQRGSALVLAILILFAMLGLGLLAMRTATQNIAGSGNLRLNKQARYVAEAGLSAVVAAMHQESREVQLLLETWQIASEGVDPIALLIDDRGRGRVMRLDVDGEPVGAPIVEVAIPVAPLLSAGPGPLGLYGEAGDLVTSFEARVEGIKLWNGGGSVSDASAAVGSDAGECLMHFTARGVVGRVAIGDDDFDDARDDVRFAEHTLRAGVVIDVTPRTICQAL